MRRLFQAQSYRTGFFSTSALNAVSQALGIGVLAAFAFFFGAQEKTDIYVYVIATVAVTSGLVTNLNAAVIIPESMRIAAAHSPRRSQEFLNAMLYGGLALAVAFSALVFIRPVATYGWLSSFPGDTLVAHRTLLMLMAPFFALDATCQFLGDIVVSRRLFTVPAVLNIMNRLVGLAAIFLLHRSLDIFSLAIGLLLAYSLQIVALLVVLRRKLQWTFAARWSAISGQCGRHLGYSLLANASSALAGFLPSYLVSSMDGGTLTALNYAQRLVGAPQTMITNHFAVIAGIKLNHLMSVGDQAGARVAFQQTHRGLLLITTTVAGLLVLNADVLIGFFQVGAFTAAAAALSIVLLRSFAPSLPLQGLNALVGRLFMAGREVGPAARFQVIMSFVNAGLLLVGLRLLGVRGYPVAMFLNLSLAMGALYFLIRRVFPFIAFGQVLRTTGLVAAIQAALAGGVFLLWRLTCIPGSLPAGLAFSALYVILVLCLNERMNWSPEARALVRQIADRWLPRAGRTRT